MKLWVHKFFRGYLFNIICVLFPEKDAVTLLEWTISLGKSILGKEAWKRNKEQLNCIRSLPRTGPQI